MEREKESTEYCCSSCVSKREKRKAELDLEEKFDYCQSCNQWVKKGSVTPYKTYQTRKIELYCPECVAVADARREYIGQNIKEYQRVVLQNRRTFLLGLVSDLTLAEWLEIVSLYGNKCADCGGEWTDLDHIIPVSKGGGTTKTNVRPLCGHCNSAKKDKDMDCR